MEPVIKLKDRGISVGVFEFDKNLSVNLQRSYKKKDSEEWVREEIHCFEDDLLKIANICTQAYNAIRNRVVPEKKEEPALKVIETPPQDDIPF